MTIKNLINEHLKEAMRARDKKRLDTLRLVSAAIKQVEVDERIEINDDRMLQILDKMAKQRKESIAQFQKANREDLIEQEVFELSVINQYLPEPLNDDQVDELVQQAIDECQASQIADMGKVMAWLKPRLQGRADMGMVSQLIKSRLQ